MIDMVVIGLRKVEDVGIHKDVGCIGYFFGVDAKIGSGCGGLYCTLTTVDWCWLPDDGVGRV